MRPAVSSVLARRKPVAVAILVLVAGCQTTVVPAYRGPSFSRSTLLVGKFNQIRVMAPLPSPFFRSSGLAMFDVPVLSETAASDVSRALADAIASSGGKVGVPDAPDLEITVHRFNLVWDATGPGIRATATVELVGRVADSSGHDLRLSGRGLSVSSSIGLMFASSAQPMIDEALSQAIDGLLRAEEPHGGLVRQLRELDELHKSGALTDEELRRAKAHLLPGTADQPSD